MPESDPYGKEPPILLPDEIAEWIVYQDDDLIVINKPGWLVCHPSKRGPRSSLIGATREFTGCETLHLVARLDRETSGTVILAKNPFAARRFQMAISERNVQKTYFAVVCGRLESPLTIDQPLGRSHNSAVHSKIGVVDAANGKPSRTTFVPHVTQDDYSTCHVHIDTGRRHQIRVHAAWASLSIAGDKLYGPDERHFLDYAENGWTSRHAAELPIQRQALHCATYEFRFPDETISFSAPLPDDILQLCRERMGLQLDPNECVPQGPSR